MSLASMDLVENSEVTVEIIPVETSPCFYVVPPLIYHIMPVLTMNFIQNRIFDYFCLMHHIVK